MHIMCSYFIACWYLYYSLRFKYEESGGWDPINRLSAAPICACPKRDIYFYCNMSFLYSMFWGQWSVVVVRFCCCWLICLSSLLLKAFSSYLLNLVGVGEMWLAININYECQRRLSGIWNWSAINIKKFRQDLQY